LRLAALNNTKLDEINKAKIDAIKSAKLAGGASNATVNRTLALIRSIMNRARDDWEWLDSVPSMRLLNEPKKQPRWLTQEEAARLLKELPEHLDSMARFALSTGLRESNITGLKWKQVDMQHRCAWIYSNQAKADKAIAVPLNIEACEIIRAQIGKNQTHVFTYEGKPVTRANNHAWRKTLKRAGIADFRWHDLRHTWASWPVQNGTPLQVLMELGGWSSLEMVLRYAHLSSDHLQGYAGNVKMKENVTYLLQAQKKDLVINT
jgi:integrase